MTKNNAAVMLNYYAIGRPMHFANLCFFEFLFIDRFKQVLFYFCILQKLTTLFFVTTTLMVMIIIIVLCIKFYDIYGKFLF